ncbi:MAG: T9SS type A sorting domain-containing protein [Saprospiraceae bacterium]|nr:T9SS type A sorting domain-containing protein [Saprospiraceae bacterium]
MDVSSEDFWLLGLNQWWNKLYHTVEEWNLGDEFQNNNRYFESVTIPGPFTTNTRLRFRCDASDDGDVVYLDDIVVVACQPSGNLTVPEVGFYSNLSANVERSSNPLPQLKSDITGLVVNLFPNPASTEMIVSAVLDQSKESPVWSVFDATGRMVLIGQTTSENLRSGLNINLENITSGIYFFKLNTTTELITKRFIVNR